MTNQEIQIAINDQIAGGTYSNIAVIAHNENEFIFDFIFAHPPKGQVNARVIMSPAHAQRLLKALEENIKVYESKVGKIKEGPEPPPFGIKLSNN
ncbi:MAG: DUF3467 domain-containing protein [Candidatus Margulisiibacteriota bacterium]|jgi:hypothetical protein